jgi:predicted deacylase
MPHLNIVFIFLLLVFSLSCVQCDKNSDDEDDDAIEFCTSNPEILAYLHFTHGIQGKRGPKMSLAQVKVPTPLYNRVLKMFETGENGILNPCPSKNRFDFIEGENVLLESIGATPNTGWLDFTYHDQSRVDVFMENVTTLCTYDGRCRVRQIGESVEKRKIWSVDFSSSFLQSDGEFDVPSVAIAANMHGDETVGREVVLHMIDWMAHGLNSSIEIQNLVSKKLISLVPSINPDGFAARKRRNANNVDLNRDYPSRFDMNKADMQVETEAIMSWKNDHLFAVSANLHGGALVCNYPWDTHSHDAYIASYAACPDDAFYKQMCSVYANAHPTMHQSQEFPGGITNGALWYPIDNSIQDYGYFFDGSLSVTIEISDVKDPDVKTLEDYWNANRDALIEYAGIVTSNPGIQGRLMNQVKQAAITIIPSGELKTAAFPSVYSNERGVFFRPLSPGTYDVQISADGFFTFEKEGIVLEQTQTGFMDIGSVVLSPKEDPSPNDDDGSDGGKDSISPWVIILGAIGCGLVVGIGGYALWAHIQRRKSHSKQEHAFQVLEEMGDDFSASPESLAELSVDEDQKTINGRIQ